METLKKFAEAVEKYVAPATSPVAVKLLKRKKEIPEKAKRPKRDFGQPIVPCQGSGLARRQGFCVAMLKEDFSLDCPTGMILFGIVKPPKWWLEGNLTYGMQAETREAAINLAKAYFRFEPGKYIGVLYCPTKEAKLDPDMVMVYCNSEQAMHLIGAARYEDGYPLTPHITASAVCSTSVVQTVQTGKCQLSIPCGGDRAHAFAKDAEIVFSAPFDRLDGISRGLKAIARVTTPSDLIMRINLGIKSPYSKRYEKLREILEQQLAP